MSKIVSAEVAAIAASAAKTGKALSNKAKAAQAKANKARQAAIAAKLKEQKAAKAAKAAEAKEIARAKAEQNKVAARSLAEIRLEAAKGAATAYGSGRIYAMKLTLEMGKGWAEIPLAGPCSDNEKAARVRIKAEKEAYQAACKSRGHSNPSTAWAQIVKYAKESTPTGERVTRGPLTKIGDGLKSVYKVLYQNCEVCSQEQQEALTDLRRALAKFGIDYTKLEA